jgi:ATP synthase protein I
VETVLTGNKKPDKSSAPMPKPETGRALSEREWSARRDALDAALEKVRVEEEGQDRKRSTTNLAGFGAALRLTSEFIAGIAVGGFVGWLIDKVAGTSPFALIVFFLLGFCAGILNLLRSAGLVSRQGSGTKDPAGQDGKRGWNGRTGKEG